MRERGDQPILQLLVGQPGERRRRNFDPVVGLAEGIVPEHDLDRARRPSQ